MGLFKRTAESAKEEGQATKTDVEQLPGTPPPTVNGVRDFWQHWDYLLSMVTELKEFGVPMLEAVGLTLNEAIIADSDLGGGVYAGDVMIKKGSRLEPRMLAVMTAMGIRKVMARPRPRVLVIALSSQSVPASFLAAAQVQEVGGEIVNRLEVLSENADEVVRVIDEQLVRADFVVTVGGFDDSSIDLWDYASRIGPSDFTPVALTLGGLHGFIMADGKIPLLALPADASAAFVLAKLVLEPIVLKLMGATPDPVLYSAKLAQPIRIIPDMLTCVPASVKAGRMTITGRPQGFEGLNSIYKANALAILASEEDLVNADTEAYYLPLK